MSRHRLGYLIVVIFAFVLLGGCRKNADEHFGVIIEDSANLLSDDTENWIRAYKYPKGFAFVVMTEQRIPKEVLGAVADERFDEVTKRHPNKNAFGGRGVLLIASEDPPLIQIRVGSEIHLLARWRGVTAGAPYIEKQLATRHQNINDGIREMLAWSAAELPVASDLPWYRRWLLVDIVQTLGSELDELSVPSEGFYGTFLLRPISAIRVLERNRFGSWWMTYMLIAVACYLLKALMEWVLIKPIRRWRPAVGNTIGLILAIALGIGLAVPSAGSAILLAGSRLEDQLALLASGLPGVDVLTFQPGTFVRPTGIWLALLLVFLRIIKGIADRGGIAGFASLADDQQSEIFKRFKEENPVGAFLMEAIGMRTGKSIEISEDDYLRSPYTYSYMMPIIDDFGAGVRWGLLAVLFLPVGLTLAAVYFWMVPIATGLFGTVRSLWGKSSAARRFGNQVAVP